MDLVLKQTIQNLLRKHSIRPSKRLGQNFLVDRSVLRKIIQTAKLSSKNVVLEIGPGLGVLTVELAKRAKQVIAIEKDRTLSRLLEDILKAEGVSNVKVINKDVLQISNSQFPASRQGGLISNYKLIANLPYYITSPVIRKFLETDNPPQLMVLMVQKEVAQRIVAKPPKMNRLAVAVQFYGKPEIVSYVSKKSFYPIPEVDSAIIKIVPQPIPKIDTKKFFELIKAGFSAKRKMLKNNLSLEASMLEKLGINPRARAENLSIEEWLKLYYCQY